MTGHAAALKDVMRIGVATDGTGMTMHFFHAVRCPLTGEIVPFHHARGAASFGSADDIDGLDFFEDIDLQFLADLEAVGFAAELANEPLWFAIGFGDGFHTGRSAAFLRFAIEPGNLPASTATGKTTRLIQIAQLHGFIAVTSFGFDLEDMARARLNDGNRNDFSGRIENLCHPDLAAE